MKFSSNKDIDKEVRGLIRKGWQFERGQKHGRLYRPDGKMCVVFAKTPGDHRSLQNFRRDLRRIVDSETSS